MRSLLVSLVLNLFYVPYPFIKQDHQIYPQYVHWCLFQQTVTVWYDHKNLHFLQCMVQ